MKITDIDFHANNQTSAVHRLNTKIKLGIVFFILLTVITYPNTYLLSAEYIILLSSVFLFKLPAKRIIGLSLYPLLFLVLLFVSTDGLTTGYIMQYSLKALSVSLSLVILIFTTPYTSIFKELAPIMPTFLANTFFITYRSIFILFIVLDNIRLSMHFRGKLDIKRPIYSIKVLSNSLGHLIIKSIETSENMYNAMRLRGFSDNIKFLQD